MRSPHGSRPGRGCRWIGMAPRRPVRRRCPLRPYSASDPAATPRRATAPTPWATRSPTGSSAMTHDLLAAADPNGASSGPTRRGSRCSAGPPRSWRPAPITGSSIPTISRACARPSAPCSPAAPASAPRPSCACAARRGVPLVRVQHELLARRRAASSSAARTSPPASRTRRSCAPPRSASTPSPAHSATRSSPPTSTGGSVLERRRGGDLRAHRAAMRWDAR